MAVDLPRYRNYQHYIREGWAKEPKFTFRRIVETLKLKNMKNARLLDIGCATGELISIMQSQFPSWSFLGIDIFDDLIKQAREYIPEHEFMRSDFLGLDDRFYGTFDFITGVGVISLFAGDDLDFFWEKAARLLKPGGTILILGPLNEFGIDMDLKHRKWMHGRRGEWERGWSIPSRQSVELAISQHFAAWSVSSYEPGLDLEPNEDPIRTWTVQYQNKNRQLTNGLKLLVDYSLIEAKTAL